MEQSLRGRHPGVHHARSGGEGDLALLDAVNPGPVNTGYLDVDTADRDEAVLRKVAESFPTGRLGEPDDPARLIAWLVSDEARWMVGQVLDTEGGFRRS